MKPWAYYNDNDKNCCAWLRESMRDGLIMEGEVDERSITEVEPGDVRGFGRRHWFAGIGGWDYALQLAGWPADEPVDTVSCPCQPFSCAGLQMGSNDPRHLFPAWRRIIARCRASVVIGEQVASSDGREWLARVRLEMASLGYAARASDLCAAGAGAPQIRQRLFWVADADRERRTGFNPLLRAEDGRRNGAEAVHEIAGSGIAPRLAGAAGARHNGAQRRTEGAAWDEARLRVPGADGQTPRLGHGHDPRPQGRGINRDRASEWSPWASSVGVLGNDGTWRRVESGIPPLAPRLPGRVALIRGSGNSIVPQIAARFIQAAYPEICHPQMVRTNGTGVNGWPSPILE